MKTSLLTAALVAAMTLPLCACESVNAGQAANRSGNREIYVSGQGAGDRVVQVQQDRAGGDAPYALRGNTGARTNGNVPGNFHGGTNGGY